MKIQDLKKIVKNKKIALFGCGTTIFENAHEFDRIINDDSFITVCYKNSISLLDHKCDIFCCDDRPNGCDISKVDAIKIYTGSNFDDDKKSIYDLCCYGHCVNSDKNISLLENIAIINSHVYEFTSILCLLAGLDVKEIYLFGVHLADGDIFRFFDTNGHFYKGDITVRDPVIYSAYIMYIDYVVPFLEFYKTPCYAVTQKGIAPFPRISFDSLFTDEKNFLERENKDPFEEFKSVMDKSYYTNFHGLSTDSNHSELFYHYFINNTHYLNEETWHSLNPDLKTKSYPFEEEWKIFQENFPEIIQKIKDFNHYPITEFHLKNYFFYRGLHEKRTVEFRKDHNLYKLIFIPSCVPYMDKYETIKIIVLENISETQISYYQNKYNIKPEETFVFTDLSEAEYFLRISTRKQGLITAIIPVRKGSERCSNKNIRLFGNTNLIKKKIECLKLVPEIDEIIVSSDSDEYLDLAESLGVKAHKRDDFYCSSHIESKKVCSYLCKEVIKTSHTLYVTVVTPFVTTKTYSDIIHKYRNNNTHTSVATAKEIKSFLWDDVKPINYNSDEMPISQNLPTYYIPTFGATIFETERGSRQGSVLGIYPSFHIVDEIEGIDIDTSYDFVISELLYKEGIETMSDVKKYLE